MKTRFWSVVTVVICSLSPIAAFAEPMIQGDMSHVADTAHVEFKGLKTWQYDVQRKDPKTVVLTIGAVTDATAAKIGSFTDAFVDRVEVNRGGPDGTYQFTFHLAGDDIETFEYQTDEPSRLILDFYKRAENPKPAEKVVEGELSKKLPPKRVAVKKSNTRKPAGSEILAVPIAPAKDVDEEDVKKTPVALRFGIFDGGDDNYDRFRVKDYEIRDEAIVASRQNIYLAFPMLKMPISKLDELMELAPEYVIRPQDTRENKEARLLLTLFERGRESVFLRTYDYFLKRYPESNYNELIKNIAADVQLRRWKDHKEAPAFDAARALYKELIEKYPSSPLRERNHLLLSFALMERGEALAALQLMQSFLDRFPSSKEIPQIRKGMAESYIVLHKFDEAVDQYKAIIKDYAKTTHAYEAQYRMGDVWFAKGDYSKAIDTYEQVIKALPSQEKVFANADYNLAEAHFWQRDYKKALNQYIQFVNNFPTHSHGGYALTRIGELMGIFGVDQRRVMGAFLESYFRFPGNAGAEVARIRMLCQQMKGMKEKERKKALEEIEAITQKSKLVGVQEFTTLMTAEGLQNRNEYVPALEQLITYYQKNPGSLNLDAFRSRILRNIANEIKARADRGEFLKALDFYSKYTATWLKNSDRIDVPYYIANAYEAAGAYGEAEKLYTESMERRKAIIGTEREKERKAHENLPSMDSFHLRIAATAFAGRNYMASYRHLKAIGEGRALTPSESIERVELAAQVYEQRNEVGKAKAALSEMVQHWKGDPQLLARIYIRLADMNFKSGDYRAAEESANKVIEANTEEAQLPQKMVTKAYRIKGDSMLADGRGLAAAEVYQTLLEKYEDREQLAVTRYKVGKILFDRGDLKGAEEVWRRLAGTSNDFLYKLGQEKLKSAKFQDDYNKYTNRIPAMVNEKKQGSKQ